LVDRNPRHTKSGCDLPLRHAIGTQQDNLSPLVGFIVTNLARPAERVVAFTTGQMTKFQLCKAIHGLRLPGQLSRAHLVATRLKDGYGLHQNLWNPSNMVEMTLPWQRNPFVEGESRCWAALPSRIHA
jgi:hypothetical protein